MTAKPRAIPDGYSATTPYLAIDGAAKAIEFYKQVFGATEIARHEMGGKVGHAELKIGGAPIMLADEFPDIGFRAPAAYGGTPVMLHLYVEDVDEVVRKAVAAGATPTRPIENQFYGDRSGQFKDPFGHWWNVASHVEDVSPAELERRSKAHMEMASAKS